MVPCRPRWSASARTTGSASNASAPHTRDLTLAPAGWWQPSHLPACNGATVLAAPLRAANLRSTDAAGTGGYRSDILVNIVE